MVALSFDFGTVTPNMGGGLPVKPDGWYTGIITQTTHKGTKDASTTGNAYLECTISFSDGTTFVERYNFWNNNEDARRIASENMAAVMLAMGMTAQEMNIQDTQQLHNRPFELYLAIEESLTDQGKKLKQNRMKAVRLKDGKVIGNVPTAPPAGAQPAGGFAAPAAPAAPQGGAPPFQAPAAPGAAPAAPAAGAQPWGGQPTPAAPPPGGGFPAPGAAPAFGGAPAPAAPGFGGAPAGGGFPSPGAGGAAPWGNPGA